MSELDRFGSLKTLLAMKEATDIVDLDDDDAFGAHRQIIDSKPFLRSIYLFYFGQLLDPLRPFQEKKIIEIGAGAFNAKEVHPGVVTSDIRKNDYVDLAVDAQAMPFEDGCLDGIVMLDTLHHLQKPRLLFAEAQRTLRDGGLLVMVEPYFSPWGHFVYKKLHHEPAEARADWDLPADTLGRLTGANLMTPYTIFYRDRSVFARQFEQLTVERIALHTCFNYMLSGGLSYRCVVPRVMESFAWGVEKGLTPLYRLLATSMTVVVRKQSGL